VRALAVPWPVRITGQMCAAALALHDRLERPVVGGHDPPGLEAMPCSMTQRILLTCLLNPFCQFSGLFLLD
jgi:hypothetical protein